MRTTTRNAFACAIALSLFLSFAVLPAQSAVTVTDQEVYEIGTEAYIYLYPLVLMDTTRRQAVNVKGGKVVGHGPMNVFTSVRTFPAADSRDAVRPNFDTLFSVAWLDLTKGPVIVSVPDTGGRYYMLQMLDMWTEVFACPGKRTTGTGAGRFVVVPPGWRGKLPDGVQRIDAPTPYVWVIGRTRTDGPMDYEAVHKVQDAYTITLLSHLDNTSQPVTATIDTTVDMDTPPMTEIENMAVGEYFAYAAELLKVNPPHITDQPIVARMRRIGIEPGKSFDLGKFDPGVQRALKRAPAAVFMAMKAKLPTLARVVNAWQVNTDAMGVYGNNYLKRAIVAWFGLGANLPEDVVQLINLGDADGKSLTGANKYVLHFAKNEIPPAGAFWSVTLYDEDGFPTANALKRYAIGDRDELKYNADGSLDLYVQNESPGKEKEFNWLPAPTGDFRLTSRCTAPKLQVLDGRWAPPAVKRVQQVSDE